MQNEPTHLDLFSGIGGFKLAAQWAGFRTIGFCERESFCQKLLKQHWPEIPIFDDICNLDGSQFYGVDLLTGGFPCQPFSQAGKRRGKADDRYLWPEMLRVIKESKPRWIIGENVAGLDGLGLDDCISDLESIGYEVAPPFEIPACAVDAKHIRNRVWIVAHSGRNRSDGRRECEGGGPCDCRRIESEWKPEAAAIERCSEALADASGSGCEEFNSPRESDSQGFSSGGITEGWREWPTEPQLGRVADGVSNRSHRLKGLGNGIVPEVAFQIIKEIRKLI